MTSVAPPPPPPLPPSGGGSAAQLTVTLTATATAQLGKLPIDSFLSGLIKAPNAQGLTTLQTSFGPLQFKAPFNLPPETPATFKVVQTQPAVQLQLSHIHGKPIALNTAASRINSLANQLMQGTSTPTALGQNSGQAAQNATTAKAPATLLNLNTASGMKAFVLSTNPQATPHNATPGTAQAVMQNPLQKALKNILPGQSKQPSATAQTATPNTTTQLNTAAHFQTGRQLNIRLISVQQPGQAATPLQTDTKPVSPNSVITQGSVQGKSPQGQPVIKLPQGNISLDTQAKMPDGTMVKLEVLSSSKPMAKATSFHPNPLNQGNAPLSQKWPALEEAFSALKDINPALADNLSNALMPKPDTRLALNMIFFLKALGRGSFKNWADDRTIKALAKSKPELLSKLEKDFTQLADKAKTPNSTDWKIAYVPLQNNGEINQIRIAQRDHQEEKDGDKDEPGVRFVIDLDLSKTGPMQLDGLAKDKSKKFDLIIRTHTALPGFMRKDIFEIYEKGMQVIGFDGNISYQVTPNFVDVDGIEVQKGEINLGMLV
ncbi:hypothetical protein [Terasakiella sp. SH-1]|uniref:hypothetical protein n=1 Tax=Terasakiella sp. SH-1 TaxID=2560057 RepID=UPI001074157E|nr:hypothetical protein [Terasakiella sp. SH-1]